MRTLVARLAPGVGLALATGAETDTSDGLGDGLGDGLLAAAEVRGVATGLLPLAQALSAISNAAAPTSAARRRGGWEAPSVGTSRSCLAGISA